ncbi:VOC family protein, partial [Deinococcus pimensis]|uniref:VOC family protein n=1 Tax=Deinococcus pimensis TaxID=309888 RepID=UPI001B7F9866
ARGGWLARLSEMNLDFREGSRFGSPVLSFEDPDGLTIELVFEDGADVPHPWRNDFVPAALSPRGFHSVTIWASRGDTLERLLVQNLGFTRVGSEPDPEGERVRYRGDSDGVGLYVDVVLRPNGRRGTFGAGSVHHVALRTRDDAEQEEYRRALTLAGYGVTPVQDRQYFHSIYFRDVSGVLFEIATDAPGFPYDEPVAELGSHLKLPDWYEPRREAIEAHVVPIVNPEYGVTIGGRET